MRSAKLRSTPYFLSSPLFLLFAFASERPPFPTTSDSFSSREELLFCAGTWNLAYNSIKNKLADQVAALLSGGDPVRPSELRNWWRRRDVRSLVVFLILHTLLFEVSVMESAVIMRAVHFLNLVLRTFLGFKCRLGFLGRAIVAVQNTFLFMVLARCLLRLLLRKCKISAH
jgi:hypothetical protein